MLGLSISHIHNRDLSKRNFFIHPPEPPSEYVINEPTNGIFVGKTKVLGVPFYWTFKRTSNPHIVIVGITGSGKSYFVKTFLMRASLVWETNAIIIDWAGEYKEWVKQTGGQVISLGKGSYLNLLDLGGMKPNSRIKQIMSSLKILTDVGNYPEQYRLTEQAIEKAYLNAGFKLSEFKQIDGLGNALKPPTLKEVQKILEDLLEEGTYPFPAELENAIYKIKKFTREGEDFFARQSTIDLEILNKRGLIDLDLSGLPDETFRALAALSILQFLKEKMRFEGWEKSKGLKTLVVLDEAWKISQDENSDVVMIVREGRKYQFGLIVASQNPTDICEPIFSNVGTTFVLRIKFEKYLTYLQNTLNFSDYIRSEIAKLGVGQCAVNMAYNITAEFSETFMIQKIIGEQLLEEFFLDLSSVMNEKQRRSFGMAKSVSFEKEKIKSRLRMFGLSDVKIEEVVSLFEKKNKRLDIISFVIYMEQIGVSRKNLSSFLKEIKVPDTVLINIFDKADFKRAGILDKDIVQVILEEE